MPEEIRELYVEVNGTRIRSSKHLRKRLDSTGKTESREKDTDEQLQTLEKKLLG